MPRGRPRLPLAEYRQRHAELIEAVKRSTIASTARELHLSPKRVRQILERCGIKMRKVLTGL